ncbi:MAG: hypothetical protein ACXWC9_02330 [Pseudobdellovibrionaceae bacterium]
MSIFNEAVRLFFAVSGWGLVGLLSAPMGGSSMSGPELSAKAVAPALRSPATKGKNAVKIADRKGSRKIILKKG